MNQNYQMASSSNALFIINHAFDRLRDTVSNDDCDQMDRTRSVNDVVDAAIEIQKRLVARRENRNLRKLYPFLQGLERYSKAIDVACNGTDYMPWIWVSILGLRHPKCS